MQTFRWDYKTVSRNCRNLKFFAEINNIFKKNYKILNCLISIKLSNIALMHYDMLSC